MERNASTTLFFAIGYFTALGLEDKHRDMLARALQDPGPVPARPAAQFSVHVTIFKVATPINGMEVDLNLVLNTLSEPSGVKTAPSFVLEKFDPAQFPLGHATPEDAFAHYLTTPDGISTFGKATAVQLVQMNINTADLGL